MLNSILRLLGPWLLKRLAVILDPESAARAKELQGRIAQADIEVAAAVERERGLEAQRAQSIKRQAELDAEIAAMDRQARDSLQRLAESREREKAIDGETKKLNAAVDARSDNERFNGVPKSGRV